MPAAKQALSLADDFASLQSLGVTDGRILETDRSEVPLTALLPAGVELSLRPMRPHVEGKCMLHAQLDDTVQQLKDRLSSLTNMPADRTLFRFHRLLPVDVDDKLTLRQLGFEAPARTGRTAADQHGRDAFVGSLLGEHAKANELTVRLLPYPAAQPPSSEQQLFNRLVQVGVRLLADSGTVHWLWLQSDETVSDVRIYIHNVLWSTLRRLFPMRATMPHHIALTAGGLRVDYASPLSELLPGEWRALHVIDVVLPTQLPRHFNAAGMGGAVDDEGEEDEAEEVEEAADEEESEEATEETEWQELIDEDVDGEEEEAGGEDGRMEAGVGSQAGAAGDIAKSQPTQVPDTGLKTAADDDDMEDGPRFCLHPHHSLRLTKPYITKDAPKTEWCCDVCGRDEEATPDRRCWHCAKCGYDVCQQCFARAHPNLPSDDTAEQSTRNGEHSGGSAGGRQQPARYSDEDDDDEEQDRTAAEPTQYHTSAKYAWLPTDFLVDLDGSVRCLSYINNLHPVQHAAMYPLVEQVVARFVPLFERVLTSLLNPQQLKVPVGNWYDAADEERHEADVEAKRAELGDDFDEDEEYEQWQEHRPVQQPLVPPFQPPPPPPFASTVSLRGRRLQLVIKLASIVLTPEQPQYAGGVWHVEGMRNECIVSSAIAYYDQSNIGPSSLAFRCAVGEPQYEQSDHRGVEAVYGLRNDEALVQQLGAVDTCSGRCIAFPNIYQHRVAPFSLLDHSQPGHRSILVAFLVDPNVSIISTSRVPPQQKDWMKRQDQQLVTDALGGIRVLSEVVGSYVDWPMSREEAEQHRAALMHERKYFVQENTATVFEREFSLCEH